MHLVLSTDYGHMIAKFLILCDQNSNPNPKYWYLGFGYKGLVFCRNNGSLMEKMDKGLTQMPQNLYAQIVCPSPKVCDENRLHWVSVVRGSEH